MHPLDNIIWKALTTRQAHLGRRSAQAAKFDKDVSLLGGLAEPSAEAYDSLTSLLDAGERVGLFLEAPPQPPSDWIVKASVPLLQMLCEENQPSTPYKSETAILPLNNADVPDMLTLTKLTVPGPFEQRTREMGDYYGIRVNGSLAAMAGERLKIPGYTEVSAVCTHPEHLGHGYATALMSVVIERIQNRGEKAFLHVRPQNARAIAVYERLGFRERAVLQYAILEKISQRE